MDSDFSEATFASAYHTELCDRWGGHLIGVTEWPSSAEEGLRRKGYDARLDSSNGFVYLAQFKVSEYMKGHNAGQAHKFKTPYYRFKITGSKQSSQHQDLLDYENKSHADYLEWWFGPRIAAYAARQQLVLNSLLRDEQATNRRQIIDRLFQDELQRIVSLLHKLVETDSTTVGDILQVTSDSVFRRLISSLGRRPNSFTRHRLLLSDIASNADTLVEYVAPRFHKYHELVLFQLVHTIPEQSVRVRPSYIGPLNDGLDHYLAFREDGSQKTLFSEPRELPESCDWGEITPEGFSGYPGRDVPGDAGEPNRNEDSSTLRDRLRILIELVEDAFDTRRSLFGDSELEQSHLMVRFLLGGELFVFSDET